MVAVLSKSLSHHWRIYAAVALGVAAATAVLTGALLIGDSVRGSLRHLVLDRLGKIDDLLVVDRFFRQEMADELNASEKFKALGGSAVPAILFPVATVQSEGADGRRVASGVLVVGGDSEFWEVENASQRPKRPPGRGEIIVNQPLADELKLRIGDSLVVRFGKASQVPADSPLGRRSDRIGNLA